MQQSSTDTDFKYTSTQRTQIYGIACSSLLADKQLQGIFFSHLKIFTLLDLKELKDILMLYNMHSEQVIFIYIFVCY